MLSKATAHYQNTCYDDFQASSFVNFSCWECSPDSPKSVTNSF